MPEHFSDFLAHTATRVSHSVSTSRWTRLDTSRHEITVQTSVLAPPEPINRVLEVALTLADLEQKVVSGTLVHGRVANGRTQVGQVSRPGKVLDNVFNVLQEEARQDIFGQEARVSYVTDIRKGLEAF